MIVNKFPERFMELLETRGFSQYAFAKKYGFHKATVNDWCRGRTQPNIETILLICRELEESSDYLLGLVD